MNLNTHQSQTVAYLENRCVNQHGLLVYHHMGTGKTNTAIAWLYNRQQQYAPSATNEETRRAATAVTIPTPSVPIANTRKKKPRTRKASTNPREITKSQSPSERTSTHHTRRTRRIRQTRAVGGHASSRRESSCSSSSDSESSSTSRASIRSSRRSSSRRTSIAKSPALHTRVFKYLIVCPETIKTTWIDESAKMGFAIDKRCLMNYEEVDGLMQAKKFDAKGKNVIFDEAHNLCRTMRREGMKYYPEVMARLKEVDKMLLLTGTPEHGGNSDFTLLINLVAGRTEFPLNDDDFQKKYRDMTIFNKRKNDWKFNWFYPVASRLLNAAMSLLGGLIIKCARDIVERYCLKEGWQLTTHADDLVKAYKKQNKMAFTPVYEKKTDDKTDDKTDENIDMGPQAGGSYTGGGNFYHKAYAPKSNDRGRRRTRHRRHGGGIREQFNRLYKYAYSATMREVSDLQVPMSRAEFLQSATESVLGLDEVFAILTGGAQMFDAFLYNMPGEYIWNIIQKYVMSSCKFLQVTHDPREALRKAPLDIKRYTKEIGRYVSFYALTDADVNFGKKVIDAKPVEALYSTFQSRQ